MTNKSTLTKPAPLDPTRLHSPSEVRQFESDTADYFKALRDIDNAKEAKEQAVIAFQNRILSDDEYFQLNLKRDEENKAKQAERETSAKALALAEIDRLMQSPPTVEVFHRNEYQFLTEVVMYANRGYTMSELLAFMPGIYHLKMDAPRKATK